jgi:tetratricopeptide (TPR) repeat protein
MRRLFVTILSLALAALLAGVIPAEAVTIAASTENLEQAWQDFLQLSPDVRAERSQEARALGEEWLYGTCDGDGAPKATFGYVLVQRLAAHHDWRKRTTWALQKILPDALADLNRARQLEPTYLPAHLALGVFYYHVGQLRNAIWHLEFLRGIISKGDLAADAAASAYDVPCCLYLAWCYRELGAWDQGLAVVDDGLRQVPESRSLLLVKGLILADSGRIDDARAFVERMPTVEIPHIKWIAMTLEFVPSSFAKDWIRAETQLAAGNPEGAQSIFAKNLEARLRWELIPWAGEYWNDVGLAFEMTASDKASRYYEQAYHNLRFHDFLPVGAGTMAPAFANLPQPGLPVFTAFDRDYVVGSPFAYVAQQLAVAHENQGTQAGDEARLRLLDRLEYLAARNIRPDFCHAMRGRLAYLDDDPALARSELLVARDLLRRSGDVDPETTLLLAQISLDSGDEQDAAAYFEEVVQAMPDAALAWRGLGISLARTGQVDRALTAMNEAVARDPGSAASWYNRGMLQYNLGNYDAAEQDMLRARELAPERTEIVTMLQAVSRARRGS